MHSYRHGKSIKDIFLVAVDTVVTCLDKRDVVCAAFLDIRKAFDSLDHCTLFHRLSDLGVYHCVKCQNWQRMRGGIPQSSALEPLLFLVCMYEHFTINYYCWYTSAIC